MTARGYRVAIRWYELVSGGETPQFIMFDNRADWASYEQAEKETLDSITERTFGRQQGAEIMNTFVAPSGQSTSKLGNIRLI